MDTKQLLTLTVKNKASDLHLLVGIPPMLRINGRLMPITGAEPLTPARAKELVFSILNDVRREKLIKEKSLDLSYSLPGGVRFRLNAYFTQGHFAAAFRMINARIPTIEELNLPEVLHQFTKLRQGFVLITGPTGHGKSTTAASMLEEINQTRNEHIISIEDPIEYVLKPDKSIISQREIGQDSLSFSKALRSCLREDPNVVFLGEMRDLETITLALTVAETGHLVFSTLHTNSAAQTIDRIIDVFPEGSKKQVTFQLANVLAAVISQRLIPTVDGSRVPGVEILIANAAVRTSIREGKTHMINNIIQTSVDMGMASLERSLANWVRQGKIDPEIAQSFALNPEELNRQLRRSK